MALSLPFDTGACFEGPAVWRALFDRAGFYPIGVTCPSMRDVEGVVQQLGLEGGLWVLITDDGRQVQLLGAPKALLTKGRRARVKGTTGSADVSIGMVGELLTVTGFELL